MSARARDEATKVPGESWVSLTITLANSNSYSYNMIITMIFYCQLQSSSLTGLANHKMNAGRE